MSILAGNTIRSRVTSTMYTKDAPLVGAPPQTTQYEPRDTDPRLFNIGLAEDGCVDIGIGLRSTLDADLTATLTVIETVPSTSTGQTLWTGTVPADCRVWWVPERGTHEPGLPLQRVYDIVELRMPIHRVRLSLTAQEAPTTGAIHLRIVRRF